MVDDFTNNAYYVANAINANAKRIAKLKSLPNHRMVREKAHKYVVAECQALGVRLSEDEIYAASALVSESL